MTKPEMIYVAPGSGFDGNDILIADDADWSEGGVKYIRADIAEELARALEQAEEVMRMLEGKPVSRMTEAEKAIMMLDRGPIDRYRTITH